MKTITTTPTPSPIRASHELRLGHKKAYILIEDERARVLVDCNVFDIAHLEIVVTPEQALGLVARQTTRASIQSIVPNLAKEVREVFISGTTPAEWDETFATRKHWRHYAALGYVFDHDDASPEYMDECDAGLGLVRPS